jgi:chromosome segregation ATPase
VSNLQRQLHDVQSSGVGQAEVARLTQRLASVEAENEDLKTELNAFDPAFFEEIEDLKHEHHQLSVQCDTQRTVIRDLSRQLGIVPPLQ